MPQPGVLGSPPGDARSLRFGPAPSYGCGPLVPPPPSEPDVQIYRIRLPNLLPVRLLRLRPWVATWQLAIETRACWRTIPTHACSVGYAG